MADLMSLRTITSTPHYLSPLQTDKEKQEKHAMLCLFGPGIHAPTIRYISKLARESAISHRLLGNVTSIHDSSTSLSVSSLLSMTGNEDDDFVHRIYLFHGGVRNGNHTVTVNNGAANAANTADLLRTMHWPASVAICQEGAEKKNKNIDYIFSCKSAKLRDDFSANEAFWKSNVSLIFSSKKNTALDHMGTALESALCYAKYCNTPANQSTLDQFKLFMYAGIRRGDCLTMLGGELKAPLVWHAPKNPEDLFLQNSCTKLSGHPLDCERLKQAIHSLTIEQLNRLPPESAQLRDMFFSRISRDDVESVKQILRADPSLINARSTLDVSALNWSIFVKAHKCTDHLLCEGADVNASDAYGITPLSNALLLDNPELVRILLASGANPDALDSGDNSPLMVAASKGWLLQVQYLLKFHAKIDVWNNDRTALTIAVEQGDYDIVNALIMAGAGASADCGLDQDLIAQAEEQGDLAIVDLLERNLAGTNDSTDSVEMEFDKVM